MFSVPTTKTEMYNILKEIFHYYRISREGYEPMTVEPLSLQEMEVETLTDEELAEKASMMLKGSQEREVLTLKKEISDKIAEKNAKIALLHASSTEKQNEITLKYAELADKIEDEASKRGVGNSTAVTEKLAELESEKLAKLEIVTDDEDSKVTALEAEIEVLENSLSEADDYYADAFEYDVEAKTAELKKEQDELIRTAFKYNNALSEKVQRYNKNIAEVQSTLQLKFMEISSNYFTKDQLVEMGYYEDVINCVCAYYDTLSARIAYADIALEKNLMIYLDDYYESVVYMYKTRAGV